MWIGGRDTGNAKGETVGECARVGVWVGVCVGKKRASADWVSEQLREETDGEQFPGTAPKCEAEILGDVKVEGMRVGLEGLAGVCQLKSIQVAGIVITHVQRYQRAWYV